MTKSPTISSGKVTSPLMRSLTVIVFLGTLKRIVNLSPFSILALATSGRGLGRSHHNGGPSFLLQLFSFWRLVPHLYKNKKANPGQQAELRIFCKVQSVQIVCMSRIHLAYLGLHRTQFPTTSNPQSENPRTLFYFFQGLYLPLLKQSSLIFFSEYRAV